MRVALIHDWLTGMRGGEKVLEVLCDLYPGADIFTLVHDRGSVSPRIERHRIDPVARYVNRPAAASGSDRNRHQAKRPPPDGSD